MTGGRGNLFIYQDIDTYEASKYKVLVVPTVSRVLMKSSLI